MSRSAQMASGCLGSRGERAICVVVKRKSVIVFSSLGSSPLFLLDLCRS